MTNIYKTNGEIVGAKPENGTDFSLEELKDIVGGYIEIIQLPNKSFMVINEEGKLDNLPFNENATIIYQKFICENDYIVGDVLICSEEQII